MKHRHWLFLILLVLVVFNSSAKARDYEITALAMDVAVDADGLVHVVEKRTVQFNGAYTGFYQSIETGGEFTVQNLSLKEAGRSYERLEQSSPGPAGTYFVLEKADETYVDWSFNAQDEERTFILSYTLDGVILKHKDSAELYYKFVGDKWLKPHGEVLITVTLPPGAAPSEVKAWGHGPAHGSVQILSGSKLQWQISDLPAKTILAGRVTFPPSLVPSARRLTGKEALPDIIAEETKWAAKINRARRYRRMDPLLGAALTAFSAFIVFSFWRRRSEGPAVKFKEKYYKELPADYPPAELAVLYRRHVSGADLTATILDLARRGWLAIEEISGPRNIFKDKGSYKFMQKEKDQADLLAYEKQVLALLFEDIAEGEVTLEQIREYAKRERKRFAEFWSDWRREITKEAEKHHFYNKEVQKKSRWFYLPAVFGLILGTMFSVAEMFFTGFGFLAAGVIFLVGAALGDRRSAKGRLEFAKWRAFRRYLQHFSRVGDARAVSAGIWEKYIPYAVTLGVAKRAFQEMEIVFSTAEEQAHFVPHWFVYRGRGGLAGMSQMTETVSRSVLTAAGQASSGSGAGGGFSGGGGGGFGGGGGGAR